MASGHESFEASKALQETLTQGRPEFEALVRRIYWGDGPVYMVGSGTSHLVGAAGAYALESLAGWPVVVRSSLDFAAYAVAAVPRRSVVVAISRAGESRQTLEAARAAHSRGAMLLALTAAPESTLAKAADGVFRVRGSVADASPTVDLLCRHAAVGYLSLVAARTLKKPSRQLETLEHEFEKLPAQVEWVLTQLEDAAGAFASQLKDPTEIRVIGGGFYRPVAMLWALELGRSSGKRTVVLDPEECGLTPAEKGGAYVFLSSSCSRVRAHMQECLGVARGSGAKVLALTDTNDRELADGASLALLLPTASELVGSTLALALLQRVAALSH
ncbi:MAG: SIS domain-containing protein [Terriglobia bacterium]